MLSLTLALIGDPNIIFMDEPTSAMDAEIRSKLRTLIKTLGKTKTIVLTTQHMDEAEELADHIALMSKGKLHTWGDVNAIKKKFGAGFNLSVFNCTPEAATAVEKSLENHITGWSVNEIETKDTVRVYTMPFNQTKNYSACLQELETQNLTLSIQMASLEESFINFHFKEMKEELDTFGQDEEEQEGKQEEIDPSFMRHNYVNIFLQILAILDRKLRVTFREYISIMSIILPGLCLAF